jgi:isoamylase
MIAHGDEIGRTQQGNNNVYCQDNELAWVDWDLDAAQESLLAFTRHVMRLPPSTRSSAGADSSPGVPITAARATSATSPGSSPTASTWMRRPGPTAMPRAVMVFLNGRAIRETDSRGGAIRDDSFLVLFNAHYEPIDFVIPEASYGRKWFVEINTAGDVEDAKPTVASVAATSGVLVPGATVTVQARSIIVVGCPLDDEA